MPKDDANPLSHAMDADSLHLPFNIVANLYETFRLSKFATLNIVAAGCVLGAFWLLRRNVDRYGYARGKVFNALEAMLVYVREKIAVPFIGKADADRFLPLLWTIFFFVLIGNLLGMLPWLGSPTGALGTTFALALCVFIAVHGSGIKSHGAVHYAQALVPPVPIFVKPLIAGIEIMSHLLRPLTLGFRLFANMLAGHLVLAVVVSFIGAAMGSAALNPLLQWGVAGTSVFAVVALSVLELLVAFVQAYLFTLLTALYIGGALHPNH